METKKVINPANKLLQERSSIRKYNKNVKINREELKNILHDAMTAPSSLNLQPWRFVVIDSEEGKKLIEPCMMFNHVQWETSSAIIAVFADKQCADYTEKIIGEDIRLGYKTAEEGQKYIEKIKTYTSSYSPVKLSNSIMLDCGFVIMQLMFSAKNYGYDTNPIGGYLHNELSAALNMDTDRYLPVLLISIGKADEKYKDTTRFSVDEITQWI